MNLESFLHEMRENPDDLAQRLVFADWLEDNGDSERAELIRLQLGAVPRAPWDSDYGTADTERERELIARIARQLVGDAGELRQHGIELAFRCGMGQVSFRGDRPADRECCVELIRSGWIERVELDVFDSSELSHFRAADLAGIHWLSLAVEHPVEGEIEAFLSTLPHLRRLELAHIDSWEGAAELLTGFPHLDWLGWSFQWATPRQLERLLPILPRCRTLSLAGGVIGDEGLSSLLDGLAPNRLHTLILSNCELTSAGIERLAECDKLVSLRALNLNSNDLRDAGVIALARSPHLRELRHLALANSDVGSLGVSALADSPLLANLLTLDLGHDPIHKEGARALATSPHLTKLVRLSLQYCSIGLAGVRDLVLSDHLPSLAAIHLDGNPIDQVRHSDKMTLADWRELCGFSLAHNPSPEEVRAMADALRHGSAPVRRHVAPRLERCWRENHTSMPVEAEAALVLALADPDGLVRRCAAVALWHVPPSSAMLPQLIELLDSTIDDAVESTLRAIAALGREASAAEEALLRSLARNSAKQEALHARALSAIGAHTQPAEQAFRSWVRAESVDLCKAGALGLARLQLDSLAVVQAWRRAANYPQKVDDALLVALGEWPIAVEELLPFAEAREPEVRGAVADVLAHAPEPRKQVLAALVALLEDAHLAPRQRACEAVRVGGWRAHELLAPLATCLDIPDLGRPAIRALRVQGDLAARVVPQLLAAGLARRQHDAFLLCRDLGAVTQRHHETFRDALRRANPVEWRLAKMALRLCARKWPDARSILSKWQDDPCQAVRLAVQEVLVELQVNDPLD